MVLQLGYSKNKRAWVSDDDGLGGESRAFRALALFPTGHNQIVVSNRISCYGTL